MLNVLYYGNMGNTGYRFCKWLREFDIDATLMKPVDRAHQRSRIGWQQKRDKQLPNWIIQYRRIPFVNRLYPHHRVRRQAQEHDIVLTSGSFIIPALCLDTPVVFIPVGGDITRLPFDHQPFLREIASYLLRHRIKSVSSVVTGQTNCIYAARLLGQGHKIFHFPLPVNMQRIQDNLQKKLRERLMQKYEKYDLVIFHPARKIFDKSDLAYKGPERLIEAVEIFLDKYPGAEVKLIAGLHGGEEKEYVDKIKKHDLREQTDFVGHLPLPQLHTYMSLPNLVVCNRLNYDVMGNEVLSGIDREALALGKPLITSAPDTARFQRLYGPDSPILHAAHPEQISEKLKNVYQMSDKNRKTKREHTLCWTKKYLDYKSRIPELINHLENISKD